MDSNISILSVTGVIFLFFEMVVSSEQVHELSSPKWLYLLHVDEIPSQSCVHLCRWLSWSRLSNIFLFFSILLNLCKSCPFRLPWSIPFYYEPLNLGKMSVSKNWMKQVVMLRLCFSTTPCIFLVYLIGMVPGFKLSIHLLQSHSWCLQWKI